MIGKKEKSEGREKMTKKKNVQNRRSESEHRLLMRFREYQGEEDGITAL